MYQNKVKLSLTFTQRLKYKAHYYKMVHSECGQNLDDDPAYKLDSVVSSVNVLCEKAYQPLNEYTCFHSLRQALACLQIGG